MSEPTNPIIGGDGAAARVRDVINDCLQRRVAGEAIADDVLIAAHPELMPDLGEELHKLRLIAAAREQAAQWMGVEAEAVSRHDSITADPSDDAAVSTGGQGDDRTMPHRARLDIAQLAAAGKLPTRFRVQSILGKGGFGAVYLAYDELLQREVALKMPCVEGLAESELKQFVEEARTLARLKHPGIVSIYDVQITEGNGVSLIMEYLAGSSLEERIKQRMTPREEAIDAVIKIAEAIQFAHEQGFVHRDLKPSNVLFDRDGQPRVADFGLAIHETNQRKHAGELSGTLPYMSPEQVRGETHRLDGRTDIWSIGVILYELLTGRRPFDGDTKDEICGEILNREPKPLRQIDRSIPADLDETCLKCLSKSVAGRFHTAGDLADRLQKFLSSSVEPVGTPAVASFLPLRQFIAQANVGRLGCGLTVTLASLLCVASLIPLRNLMQSNIQSVNAPAMPIAESKPKQSQDTDQVLQHERWSSKPTALAAAPAMSKPQLPDMPTESTSEGLGPLFVKQESNSPSATNNGIEWVRNYPFVPSSGGDPITASNDATKQSFGFDSVMAHVSTYPNGIYMRSQWSTYGPPPLIGQGLPALIPAPTMYMLAQAQAAWTVTARSLQEQPWTDAVTHNRQRLEAQRKQYLEALRQKQDARRDKYATAYRLTNEQINRQSGAIAWPKTLQVAEYDKLRSRADDLFRQRAKASDTSPGAAQIAECVEGLRRELRQDISRLDKSEYAAAQKFLLGLKYEVSSADTPPPTAGAEPKSTSRQNVTAGADEKILVLPEK